MLSMLKGELVKKGLNPTKAIMEVTGCSENTARKKLKGKCAFTVPEAVKITNIYFSDCQFTIEDLFTADKREGQVS